MPSISQPLAAAREEPIVSTRLKSQHVCYFVDSETEVYRAPINAYLRVIERKWSRLSLDRPVMEVAAGVKLVSLAPSQLVSP